MLNFVLCDDNLSFLNGFEKNLNKLIVKNDFDAKIGLKSTNISDVLEYMKFNKIDVLFLDIILKTNENGIEKDIITKANLPYFGITCAKLEREFTLKNFTIPSVPFSFNSLIRRKTFKPSESGDITSNITRFIISYFSS